MRPVTGLFLILMILCSVSIPLVNAKSSWPEVVGMSAMDAQEYILLEDPTIAIRILPTGSIVTGDHRIDRVRLFVDDNGIVQLTPRRG